MRVADFQKGSPFAEGLFIMGVIAIAAVQAPASAGAHDGDRSAGRLVGDCRSASDSTRASCRAVVPLAVALIGPADGRSLCRPETEDEQVESVLQWIEARPELHDVLWTEAVEDAVRGLWTC